MASTLKIVEALLENAVETHEKQDMLLDLCSRIEPDAAAMQNSDNFVWGKVQQHAPIISGFDLTGLETDIIQETYPRILGTPSNDFVVQRADDLRDMQYWIERGKVSGQRQASELNKAIATAIVNQGSLHYRSNATSGYDFIAEGQAMLNEEQGMKTSCSFVLNDRDTLKYSKDLASRETIKGRPADTWRTGQIGSNVAEFDVYTGSFLPNVNGVVANTTVNGAQTFAPDGGSVDATTGVVTNVDYRYADIPLDATGLTAGAFVVGETYEILTVGTTDFTLIGASASTIGVVFTATGVGAGTGTARGYFAIGDKVTFAGVNAVGREDKTSTNRLKTFTVVGHPSANTLRVYPKPIAAVDGALSSLELAYANTDVVIANAAAISSVNIGATAKANIFFDKSAVEVMTGTIPASLFAEFGGSKVASANMKNGQTMYILYDGDIATLNFRYRLFTWYGITVANPQMAGVATSF